MIPSRYKFPLEMLLEMLPLSGGGQWTLNGLLAMKYYFDYVFHLRFSNITVLMHQIDYFDLSQITFI